jgi:hypothetical protein
MAPRTAGSRSDEHPTDAQLKELFAQIERGKITKGHLQELLHGNSDTVTEYFARKILGEKYFFGSYEWGRCFDVDIPPRFIPTIPWTKDEIKNQFLFLGLKSPNGVHLDLQQLSTIFRGKGHPRFNTPQRFFSHSFAKEGISTRWYSMTIGVIEGSNLYAYGGQMRMIGVSYEMPTAMQRIVANILYYFLNQEYLDDRFYTRTCSKDDNGLSIAVCGSEEYGICINPIDDMFNSFHERDIGISQSRLIDFE